MLRFIPAPFSGLIAGLYMLVWITLIFAALLPFIVIKFILPLPSIRRWTNRVMARLGKLWMWSNHAVIDWLYGHQWDVRLPQGALDENGSYLILCNHHSWVDIPVMVSAVAKRAPMPRFFMKWELLFVPIIGWGTWAMDFPFMRRYSKEKLEKHPELRGKDIETTRRSCERFRGDPLCIVNFSDGTRVTEAKRREKQSPYQHLLRPKAGGLSFVLNSIGDQFDALLDVTLIYPADWQPNFWRYLCGEPNQVIVDIRTRPIPQGLLRGDYEQDAQYREQVQAWLNGIWAEKDERISAESGTISAR